VCTAGGPLGAARSAQGSSTACARAWRVRRAGSARGARRPLPHLCHVKAGRRRAGRGDGGGGPAARRPGVAPPRRAARPAGGLGGAQGQGRRRHRRVPGARAGGPPRTPFDLQARSLACRKRSALRPRQPGGERGCHRGAAAPADVGAPRRARAGGGAGGARAAAGRAGGEPGGRRARGGRGRRRCARRRVARAPALQRGRAARARLLPCCSSASRA